MFAKSFSAPTLELGTYSIQWKEGFRPPDVHPDTGDLASAWKYFKVTGQRYCRGKSQPVSELHGHVT